MAEALAGIGAAASIVQLISTGCHLLNRINDFRSSTEDDPAMFRDISIQLPFILDSCKELSKDHHVVDMPSSIEIIEGCLRHVQDLDNLISKTLPTSQDSSVRRTWKAIGSVRTEKKILDCQRALETYKTALILLVNRRNTVPSQSLVQSQITALSTQRDSCYIYPSSRISHFIGRKDLLRRLDDILLSPSPHARPNVCVLLGMGGQGKTALALEYCRRAHNRSYFKSILWIDADSLATVAQSFENLADHLAKRQRPFKDLDACLRFVKDTIEDWGAPWLVVFDNFDQPGKIPDIMSYVPHSCNGAVLVTSRHAESAALGKVFEMDSMEEDDSVDLLLHRTRDVPTFQNVEGARAVVHLLGFLPLAVDQAGAYIRARKISFSAFLDHYQNRRAKVLQHTPDLWDYRKKLGEDKNETSFSVYTTWELSFQQVAHGEEQKVQQGHFMTLLGFFHNLDIREQMFKAYYHRSSPSSSWIDIFTSENEWDAYNYEDAVVNLSQLCLLQHSRPKECTESWISLHPLIRDWTQYRLDPAERSQYTTEAMSVVKSYILQNESETEKWSLQTTRKVLMHIDTCVQNYVRFCPSRVQVPSEELRDSMTKFGLFYTRHGQYRNSEDLFQIILSNDETSHGPKHVKTLETKLYLTDVYLGLGRYREAESMLQDILPKSKKLSNTLRARISYNLAKVSFKQGRYSEALRLYQSALQDQEPFLPLGHPELLCTYEALAQVYRNQGLNGEAIALYSKTLDSYIQLHGKNHPDTFSTMNNLGNCYRNLARFDKAEEIYINALRGNEMYLGPDHPNTLNNTVNLAINHMYRYKYQEAERLYTTALATYEVTLGLEHPETLRTNLNYASLHLAQGHCEEASKRLKQVLEGRLKKLGVHSDYTLYAIERLLSALWLGGQMEEADSLANRMLRIQENDPRSEKAFSVTEQAILEKSSPYSAVEVIFTRTLARRYSSLAWTHNDITELSRSLALVYSAQHRSMKAEEILLKILQAYEHRCGPDHTLTVRTKDELFVLRATGTISVSVGGPKAVSAKLESLLAGEEKSQTAIGLTDDYNHNLDFIKVSVDTLGLT